MLTTHPKMPFPGVELSRGGHVAPPQFVLGPPYRPHLLCGVGVDAEAFQEVLLRGGQLVPSGGLSVWTFALLALAAVS
nr:hypothetical protein [Streptomyces antibioticus]